MLDSFLEERKSPSKLMQRPKYKKYQPIDLGYRRNHSQPGKGAAQVSSNSKAAQLTPRQLDERLAHE